MSEKDRYDALSEWAERGMTIDADEPTILRGESATAFGREMLERAGVGRPRLDPTEAVTGRSPRRQVRLSQALSDRVDKLAATQGRAASEVMRDAISDYLDRNQSA
ncbi:MAG: CopG family ribbon-helix-helix protein [Dermatophilaceae bacterium]